MRWVAPISRPRSGSGFKIKPIDPCPRRATASGRGRQAEQHTASRGRHVRQFCAAALKRRPRPAKPRLAGKRAKGGGMPAVRPQAMPANACQASPVTMAQKKLRVRSLRGLPINFLPAGPSFDDTGLPP